jgi:hypothetical protein
LRNVSKRLGLETDEQAIALVNKATTDPAFFAQLIRDTPPKDRNKLINLLRSDLPKMLEQYGGGVVQGGAAGGAD